jgi:DNA-3-methyladenine glycosylase I
MSADTGLIEGPDGRLRCWWHGNEPDYLAYHDQEWGRPVDNDNRLFEKICLEGFQAGLSWLTILRKRDNFRKAFAGFDFRELAGFTEADIDRLMDDAGIVRHRGKIESTVNNANRAIELVEEAGSLAAFVWSFEPAEASRPQTLDKQTLFQMAKTAESNTLSKELKKRGWTFVGPTTAYAFMQSMGLVNDHLEGCICREAVEADRREFLRPS